MNKETMKEEFKIFKRTVDQTITDDFSGEPTTDWNLVTDGEIESEIIRDDKGILIKAVFLYKAFDAETLLSEVTKKAFESFIWKKLDTRYRLLPNGNNGWFGKPVFAELTYYNSKKVEFILKHERDTDVGGGLNKNDFKTS